MSAIIPSLVVNFVLSCLNFSTSAFWKCCVHHTCYAYFMISLSPFDIAFSRPCPIFRMSDNIEFTITTSQANLCNNAWSFLKVYWQGLRNWGSLLSPFNKEKVANEKLVNHNSSATFKVVSTTHGKSQITLNFCMSKVVIHANLSALSFWAKEPSLTRITMHLYFESDGVTMRLP